MPNSLTGIAGQVYPCMMLAGCVLGYCVYLTWSALTSEAVDRVCVHNGGTGSRGVKVMTNPRTPLDWKILEDSHLA